MSSSVKGLSDAEKKKIQEDAGVDIDSGAMGKLPLQHMSKKKYLNSETHILSVINITYPKEIEDLSSQLEQLKDSMKGVGVTPEDALIALNSLKDEVQSFIENAKEYEEKCNENDFQNAKITLLSFLTQLKKLSKKITGLEKKLETGTVPQEIVEEEKTGKTQLSKPLTAAMFEGVVNRFKKEIHDVVHTSFEETLEWVYTAFYEGDLDQLPDLKASIRAVKKDIDALSDNTETTIPSIVSVFVHASERSGMEDVRDYKPFNIAIEKYRKDVKGVQATLKDFRHLFNTSMQNAGMPEFYRRYLLGQSPGRSALVNYTHLNDLRNQYERAVNTAYRPLLITLDELTRNQACASPVVTKPPQTIQTA